MEPSWISEFYFCTLLWTRGQVLLFRFLCVYWLVCLRTSKRLSTREFDKCVSIHILADHFKYIKHNLYQVYYTHIVYLVFSCAIKVCEDGLRKKGSKDVIIEHFWSFFVTHKGIHMGPGYPHRCVCNFWEFQGYFHMAKRYRGSHKPVYHIMQDF